MARPCNVEGCKRPHESHGFCGYHATRFRRYGNPQEPLRQTRDGEPLEFIVAALDYTGRRCLLWPYSKDQNGNARIAINKVPRRVNRIVCGAVYGKAPEDKPNALHRCGNGHRGCITPKHLYWGSQKDNAADMLRHGRGSNQFGCYQE